MASLRRHLRLSPLAPRIRPSMHSTRQYMEHPAFLLLLPSLLRLSLLFRTTSSSKSLLPLLLLRRRQKRRNQNTSSRRSTRRSGCAVNRRGCKTDMEIARPIEPYMNLMSKTRARASASHARVKSARTAACGRSIRTTGLISPDSDSALSGVFTLSRLCVRVSSSPACAFEVGRCTRVFDCEWPPAAVEPRTAHTHSRRSLLR